MEHQGTALLATYAAREGRVSLEQRLGNLAKNTQIFRTMILVDLYAVLRKLDVQLPVKVVFNTPVAADQLAEALCIIGRAADVVSVFGGWYAVLFTSPCHANHRGQLLPLLLSFVPAGIVGHIHRPMYMTAVFTVIFTVSKERFLFVFITFCSVKILIHGIIEVRLISFDCQHIVGLQIYDFPGDFRLTAHRVDCYGRSSNVQGFK